MGGFKRSAFNCTIISISNTMKQDKISSREEQIDNAVEYLNRSKESRKRSLRPVAMIPSWGIVVRLGVAFTRKHGLSQIGERQTIKEGLGL
jgi:hypothetical protein